MSLANVLPFILWFLIRAIIDGLKFMQLNTEQMSLQESPLRFPSLGTSATLSGLRTAIQTKNVHVIKMQINIHYSCTFAFYILFGTLVRFYNVLLNKVLDFKTVR